MLYLAQIITLDKSPKYSCPFFLAPMVTWGSKYSSIILLIHIVYLNCNMLGTNKVVVVVVVVVVLKM